MDAYWAAKRALFDWPGLRAAVINVDDAHRRASWRRDLHGDALELWTRLGAHGGRRRLTAQRHPLRRRRPGLRRARRRPSAAAAQPPDRRLQRAATCSSCSAGLRALGVSLADAAAVVPQLTPVPGRMQRVAVSGRTRSGGRLRPHARRAGARCCSRCGRWPPRAAAQLWCVFGCGGNRDATKRPLMGAIAARRRRPRDRHQRQPAPRTAGGDRRADRGRCGAAAAARPTCDRRPPRGHRARAARGRRCRRGADRRQGPRGLPGDRRRRSSRSPTSTRRRARCAGAAGTQCA